jgi:hypothetical protein
VELSPPVAAAELLEREFLEIRARLLQVAAALDRIDRAQGDVFDDKRRLDIDRAIEVLAEKKAHRAERLQMIFSLAYDRNWKKTLGLHNGEASDAK